MATRPTRAAAPSKILDAASCLAAQIERSTKIGDAERDLWYSALTKAVGQLMDGVRYQDNSDGSYTFPSRTRSGIAHRSNGKCTCESYTEQGQPCWHRAATGMLKIIAEAAQPAPAPQPAAAPAAPARRPQPAQASRPQPAPARAPRPMPRPASPQPAPAPQRRTFTAEQSEQIRREMAELFS